jgi:hypothetical protein
MQVVIKILFHFKYFYIKTSSNFSCHVLELLKGFKLNTFYYTLRWNQNNNWKFISNVFNLILKNKSLIDIFKCLLFEPFRNSKHLLKGEQIKWKCRFFWNFKKKFYH